MATNRPGDINTEKLLRDFKLYDQAVDIVSAHHWWFENVAEMAGAVEHFERYPRFKVDGRDVTPDFTVLFTDGRAIAAEIAHLSLHENSVDSLCRQVSRYSALREVPGSRGGVLKPANLVDVALFIPMEIGDDAARRIFEERLDSPTHEFTAERRPVLIQYAYTNDRYVFQKWPDAAVNGRLAAGSTAGYEAVPAFGVRPDRFLEYKVRYGLMNDPVKPLYLAARLWMNVFPDRFWVDGSKNVFSATLSEIGAAVRSHYGRGKNGESEAAMAVLVAAGLARLSGMSYVVPRSVVKGDFAETVISRIKSRGSGTPQLKRRPKALAEIPGQQTLFD